MKRHHKILALFAGLAMLGIGAVSYSTSTNVHDLKVVDGGLIANIRGGDSQKIPTEKQGEWTPTIGASSSDPSITYAFRKAYYLRSGNLVCIWVNVTWNAGSGGSGNAALRGLPYLFDNNVATGFRFYVNQENISWSGGTVVDGFSQPNGDIHFRHSGDAASGGTEAISVFTSGTFTKVMRITGCYVTSDPF